MKVKKNLMVFVLLTAVLSMSVFAAGQQEAEPMKEYALGERTGLEPEPTTKTGKLKFGLTPTAMNTHYDIVIAGAKQAVAVLGGSDKIELVIQAPSGQSAVDEQMNIVEGWVQQGYDAILIASQNDQALTPMYRRAAEKGIPIIHFNTPLAATVNPYYISNVGYDQTEAGYMITKWLGENYGSDAEPFNIILIEGLPGIHNHDRMIGVNKAFGEYPGINVLESQNGDWVRNTSQAVMEDMLTKWGDKIDGVIGLYDEMSLGALAAIKSRNLDKEIVITGYDNTPDANKAIVDGFMHATVDTAPKGMGYEAVMTAYAHVAEGKQVDKVINLDLRVWDQDNVDEFDTDNYIFVE